MHVSNRRLPAVFAVTMALWFDAAGQTANTHLIDFQNNLSKATSVLQNLPRSQQARLSAGAQNALRLTRGWEAEPLSPTLGGVAIKQQLESIRNSPRTFVGFPAPVNNPGTDFLFSAMAGFTQSETSTAWCGPSVVVGYNDSGSLYETLLFGPGGAGFSGASYSTDGGRTFTDSGAINPGPNPLNFLSGDPVVNCVGPNTFYYTQILMTGTVSPFSLSNGAAVSKSVNGGATWSDPVAAIVKDAGTHFIDKPWSAVDPKHPKHLWVSYTDIDQSGAVCTAGGVPVPRIAIELVRSTDGGSTWSAPVVLDEQCNVPPLFPFVQASQIAVDSGGTVVYVAWEAFSGIQAELRVSKSTNGGAAFAPFVKAADVVFTGDHGALQGGIRNLQFPSLAIDRSTGPTAGTLYLAWNDGRLLQHFDLESPTNTYNYADIFVVKSTDGATWSAPVRVNDDPVATVSGRGTDQFQPGMAVDSRGVVGACWYDRRGDPANYFVGRSCATSPDAGITWVNQNVPVGSWPPIHAADAVVNPFYLGDYDSLAADTLGIMGGFSGAFGNVEFPFGALVPNQNVHLVKFE